MTMFHKVLIFGLLGVFVEGSVLKFEPSQSENVVNTEGKAEKTPPTFCNKLDCPNFDVIKTTEDYQIRKYTVSNWVTTGITGVEYSGASYTLFMRLFRYISGNNEKQEKIDMTCPVIMRIIPGQGAACASNFTMSFYVAPKVKSPPAPTDKDVALSQLEEVTVFVRMYGGFSEQSTFLKEAAALGAALERDGLQFKTGYYYTAGYDAPYKIFNRHNEIWFMAA